MSSLELKADALRPILGQRPRSVTSELIGQFSCELHKLTVELDDGTRRDLVLKRPKPGNPVEVIATERQFYESVAASLPMMPAYVGFLPEAGGLVLEHVDDLERFSFRDGPTAAHAADAEVALAALHSLRIPASLEWLPRFDDAQFVDCWADEYAEAWPRRRHLLLGYAPEFAAHGDALVTRLRDLLPRLANAAALLHGDAHLENLPARRGGGVCMLDWQDPLIGDPGFDVADMLVMSFPTAARRARERESVARHARRIGRPEEDAWAGYRLGIVARVTRVVRIADRHPAWAQSSLPWVFRRCAVAALDHGAVGDGSALRAG